MADFFSDFFDIIFYFLGSIFGIVVLIVFYFRLKDWLKRQRRKNRRRRYENHKLRKASRNANKKS